MTDRFAVMGNPIAHSLSPIIHQQFAAQVGLTINYEKMLIEPSNFQHQVYEFFESEGKGLNITLPYKAAAFALSEERTNRATKAQAVNTLWMKEGRLHGDTTDGVGLLRDLSRYVDITNKSILLLGTGGVSSGIIASLLLKKPARLTIVFRTRAKAKALQKRFPTIQICSANTLSGHYDLVLNATSASLNNQIPQFNTKILTDKPFCYDLAYHQISDTPWITLAKSKGCQARDGLGMLVEQAAESFRIWHGVMPDTTLILEQLLLKKSTDG